MRLEEAGGTPALPAAPPGHYPAACAPPPMTHKMTLLSFPRPGQGGPDKTAVAPFGESLALPLLRALYEAAICSVDIPAVL